MKTITSQKTFEEIKEALHEAENIYLVGCGTCATMCHTGGIPEVLEMKGKLKEIGKKVTGWIVLPVACDDITKEALSENAEAIAESDAILVMSCAFGVQTVTLYANKPVYPALNTLFIGKEDTPGHFSEVCIQCGECVLALTGGICPVTTCPKGLLNGPCGGTKNGKCEVSPDIPCAWVRIYERLKELGRLDDLKKTISPKDWSKGQRPGSYKIGA
jgi:ferredoxin